MFTNLAGNKIEKVALKTFGNGKDEIDGSDWWRAILIAIIWERGIFLVNPKRINSISWIKLLRIHVWVDHMDFFCKLTNFVPFCILGNILSFASTLHWWGVQEWFNVERPDSE